MTKKNISNNIKLNLLTLFNSITKLRTAKRMPAIIKDDDKYYAPIIIWRLLEEDPNFNVLLKKAFEKYAWHIDWKLNLEGLKGQIYPKYLEIVKESEGLDSILEASNYLMSINPDFGKITNKDLEEFTVYFSNLIKNY